MEKNKLLLFSVAIWNTVSILGNIAGKVHVIIKWCNDIMTSSFVVYMFCVSFLSHYMICLSFSLSHLVINVTRWIVITYLIHPVKSCHLPFFFYGSSWLIKIWNDATSYAMLFTCHAHQNWFELVTVSLNHVLPTQNGSTPWPLLGFPIIPPDDL